MPNNDDPILNAWESSAPQEGILPNGQKILVTPPPQTKKTYRENRPGQLDWDGFSKQKTGPVTLLCDRVIRRAMEAKWSSNKALFERELRAAHRVVFDNDALARLGDVCAECPSLIMQYDTFARQPWNPMWVEMTCGGYDAGSPDDRYGFLFAAHNVYPFMICGEHTAGELLLGSAVYHLHQPTDDWWTKLGLSEDRLDQVLIGPDAMTVDPELRAAFRLRHYASGFRKDFVFGQDPCVEEFEGELLRILAILLLLNRPGLTKCVDKSGGRTFVNGKSRPYMSHSILHFILDPRESVRALHHASREPHGPVRWHQVRDHYCHNKDWTDYSKIGCVHTPIQTDKNWVPAPDLPPLECSHWICEQCGGRRWRRVLKNGRGSAAVGFVQQDMTLVESKAQVVASQRKLLD